MKEFSPAHAGSTSARAPRIGTPSKSAPIRVLLNTRSVLSQLTFSMTLRARGTGIWYDCPPRRHPIAGQPCLLHRPHRVEGCDARDACLSTSVEGTHGRWRL